MNEAFVQDSEHQIDDQDCHQQQHSESAQRILEGLSRALIAGGEGSWKRIARELLHLVEALRQRDSWREVERYRNRRQLARMVDGERPDAADEFDYRAQRHQRAIGRSYIK